MDAIAGKPLDLTMWDKLRGLSHQAWELQWELDRQMHNAEYDKTVTLDHISDELCKLIDMFAVISGVLK
jgi:hypothetical protein